MATIKEKRIKESQMKMLDIDIRKIAEAMSSQSGIKSLLLKLEKLSNDKKEAVSKLN